MKSSVRKIRSILVPIGPGETGNDALKAARILGKEIILVGIVTITEGESISAGSMQARQVRKRLLSFRDPSIRFKSAVIVSEKPWKDLLNVISLEKPDLVLFEWKDGQISCGISVADAFSQSISNAAILSAHPHLKIDRTLIAVRGGPHAELALSVGIGLKPSNMDVLHLSLVGNTNDAPFKGLKHILNQLPEVKLRSIVTEDAAKTITEESQQYDLVVMGATAKPGAGNALLGPVAEKLIRESKASVMVVKTPQNIAEAAFDESVGAQAISILVDKWFAENTFHADEFSDLKRLMELKQKQGVKVTLALPALNEEKTVGKVITTVKKALMDDIALLDEILLIDSNSEDQTRQIATDLGIPVYIHQELLPELGSRTGKGEALWKSLLVSKGDIIAWIDTDIVNIHPRFVYGIIGPLLLNPTIQFVKGFYRRPLKVGNTFQLGSGGRVTELSARPLLNLFYPELSGVIQPLSGEYAGRRKALEKATFFSGYGVETGLLIDVFENFGLHAIAQADLLERIHHNQGLEALGKMSFAIIQTVLRKLESRYERAIIEDVNKTMKLIRYSKGGYYLDVEEIAEKERPPMITIKQYLERHKG